MPLFAKNSPTCSLGTPRRLKDSTGALQEISGGADPSEDLSESSAAMEALKLLSPQERQIVVLTSIYGYTTREVAGMLGCPHGTVSSKLHRSLAKLRAILQ